MLAICKPLTFVPQICLLRSIARVHVRHITRAVIEQKAMSHALSSKSLLEDQAFGGDLLDRSVGDRRDPEFVKTSFESSGSLLISGRSVMAKQASGSNGSRQHADLCWLSPGEFAEYGIAPQTDSQTSVTGKSSCNTGVSGQMLPNCGSVHSISSSLLLQINKQELWFHICLGAPSKRHGHLPWTHLRTANKNSYITLQSKKVPAAHCSFHDTLICYLHFQCTL